MKKRMISLMLAAALAAGNICFNNIPVFAADKLLAFPGAEGGGMYTLGARAANNFEIYHVTNLNDSGAGSFRDALSQGNRIIVFDISGTIMLESVLSIKDVDNITILGQTAPGEGICIGGESTLFENCNNIIVRYMRFRPGDLGESQEDGLGLKQCTDVIIDHCSVSWSVDECFSAYANRNFTAQYNIISNSLNTSVHEKGSHGYGGIWGGENASFHHNLISSHYSRMPRIGTSMTVRSYMDHPDSESLTDIRNNVFYNWGNRAGYGGENNARVNFVNNYYKRGPATEKDDIYVHSYSVVYASGNILEGNEGFNKNNYTHIFGNTTLEEIGTNGEFLADYPVNTETARQAYDTVLSDVGASYARDDIDKVIINDVINGTATSGSKGSKYLIDSQEDMGGWVWLEGAKITDTDGDSIPDDWENTHSLNKNDPTDATKISSTGYTNIENYANDVVKTKLPEKSTDTMVLRQTIFKAEHFDREYFYTDGYAKLDNCVKDAKAALNGTQVQADSAKQAIDDAFAELSPRYKKRLQDLIKKVEKKDMSPYMPQDVQQLRAATDKARTDLEGAEDNAVFKADYDEISDILNNLTYSSEMRELNTVLNDAKSKTGTQFVYTAESVAAKIAAIETVEKALAEGGLTTEKIEELTGILRSVSLVEIKYDTLEHDIELLENGILGKKYLDADTLAKLDKLKAECKELAEKKFDDNTEIDEIDSRILNAIKDIKHSKNYIYLQDFEGEKPDTVMGSYTVETDGKNSYAHITEPLTLIANTPEAGEDVYYSIDFPDTGKKKYRNAVIGLVFGDKYIARVQNDPYWIRLGVSVCNTTIGLVDESVAEGYIKDADGWNNMTLHFSPTTRKLTVYCNNSRVYEVQMPDDCGNVTSFGIIDYSYMNNDLYYNENAFNADNMAVFGLDGQNFVYGDADCDNSVTASDAALVLQKTLTENTVLPIENKTENWLGFVDVDSDNKLTASDAAMILQKTLNESLVMPSEKE